jgi:hypothetical protein
MHQDTPASNVSPLSSTIGDGSVDALFACFNFFSFSFAPTCVGERERERERVGEA